MVSPWIQQWWARTNQTRQQNRLRKLQFKLRRFRDDKAQRERFLTKAISQAMCGLVAMGLTILFEIDNRFWLARVASLNGAWAFCTFLFNLSYLDKDKRMKRRRAIERELKRLAESKDDYNTGPQSPTKKVT